MALFWFDQLGDIVPNHLTGDDPQSVVAADERAQVRGRSMLVKRLKPLPVEAVVRGYLAGSGWKEYQAERHGLRRARCRPGLRNACEAARADLHAGDQGRGRRARREHRASSAMSEIVGADARRSASRDVAIAPLRDGGGDRADEGHHHRRHQVRVRPRPRRHADADGRGADARLVALLAGRRLRRRQQPAELRQAVRARLARAGAHRRQALEQEGAGAAAAGRGGRSARQTSTARRCSASSS